MTAGDWKDEDFDLKPPTPTLPAVRPEYHKVSPPLDVIMLCDQCQRHLLRYLQSRWWCYGCGHRPSEPTLIYDRRR